MTRLTLYWHLRAIVEGVPGEAHTTGSGEYTPKDGRVCDSYSKHIARSALQADDEVAYLDKISKDPAARLQWRNDAAELLSTHIMERRAICSAETRSISEDTNPDEEPSLRQQFVSAVVNDRLPKRSMQSARWSVVSCPNCGEEEVLYDFDEDEPLCHCGTRIEKPTLS